MTTKEQERKALAQIRKIVEGLGKDSYIGMAFEGCFEMAEDNIANDFGNSMMAQRDACSKKLFQLEKDSEETIKHLQAVREIMEKKLSEETARADKNFQEALRMGGELRELKEKGTATTCDMNAQIADMKKEIEEKDMEIMKLKAKLFDLLVK